MATGAIGAAEGASAAEGDATNGCTAAGATGFVLVLVSTAGAGRTAATGAVFAGGFGGGPLDSGPNATPSEMSGTINKKTMEICTVFAYEELYLQNAKRHMCCRDYTCNFLRDVVRVGWIVEQWLRCSCR